MQKLPPLLSELELGTFLRYSQSGTSQVSKESRDWRSAIKAGKPAWISYARGSLNGVWPSRIICEGLVARGLGRDVIACLERTEVVPKSAFAEKGERPTAERHLETIRVDRGLFASRRITLVDDIVTIGRTLLAAASHLRAAFPDAEVRGFGLMHTWGVTPEIEAIMGPYVGRLCRTGGWIGHEPPQ